MYRRAQDDPVRRFHFLDPLVDLVTRQDTLLISVLETLAAGGTAADHLIADMHDLGFDPLLFKFRGHHLQRMPGIAFLVGTVVERYYFHINSLLTDSDSIFCIIYALPGIRHA